jgi:hypothetical protein
MVMMMMNVKKKKRAWRGARRAFVQLKRSLGLLPVPTFTSSSSNPSLPNRSYIDDDETGVVLNVAINETFWERGGWSSNPSLDNPWVDSPNANAPFDQRMYLIMNIAVGGTNGYFPDGQDGKPWSDTSPNAMDSFWSAVGQWYPTWQAGGAEMVVDSVRVWQTPGTGADYAYRLML